MEDPMIQLLSLTGPSGTGKTTLAGAVIKSIPGAKMVPSYTTRSPRPNDLPGEYCYITKTAYGRMYRSDKFLWAAEHGGNCYGTTPGSIRDIFKSEDTLGIMILVPAVIPLLRQFLKEIGRGGPYLPVFVIPPPREVLEKRLKARGDLMKDIQLRLDEAEGWLKKAIVSGSPYSYIRNDGEIKDAATSLLKVLHR